MKYYSSKEIKEMTEEDYVKVINEFSLDDAVFELKRSAFHLAFTLEGSKEDTNTWAKVVMALSQVEGKGVK